MKNDIVFTDLDGTLIDSEEARINTYYESFDKLKISGYIKPNINELLGNSEIHNLKKIMPTLDREEIVKLIKTRQYLLLNLKFNDLRPNEKILDKVKSYNNIIVVTNSSISYATRIINKLLPRCQFIVTPNAKLKPKPQPDMYNFAFTKFALNSKKIVFEDSTPGIISAKSAGADLIYKVVNNNQISIV